MKVSYIGHSGFAVELAGCTLLFDYYQGVFPPFALDKPLYVFASHAHQDHFNFAIFGLGKAHPNVTYILSRDIKRKWSAAGFARHGVSKETYDALVFLGAHETKRFGPLCVETFASTDAGVAFLISACGETIFHAGDLNDWVWEGEPPEENQAMTARFQAEVGRLSGRRIDAAFLVLDPRQEADFAQGFDYFMRHTDTVRAYPMHFWNDFSVFARLRALPCSAPYRGRVALETEYGSSAEGKCGA